MTINIMLSLDLRPIQRRHIKGMIATLTVVRDYGYGPNVGVTVRRVLDELEKALLQDATFDTIVGAKFLLNDFTGQVRLSGDASLADCLQFVGDGLQSLFDYYTNLADCRGL